MELLPICLDVRQRQVLLVGGGSVAARKASLLMRAGARLRLVAPECLPALKQDVLAAGGDYLARAYQRGDSADCCLVIAATDDAVVNRQIHADAMASHVPVNVVDTPELCSVVFPSIIDRSPVLIAISSGGSSPVLARLLRARLESIIPAAYGRLAALARAFRQEVATRIPEMPRRRAFWESALQGVIAEKVFSGRDQEAANDLRQMLDQTVAAPQGEVYLVGAGPGDPDLLTFRALRLMQQADVVLYDRLVAPAIVDLCRRDAERIYVGKRRADHAMPQEGINALLVRLAQEGKKVCRLKGGDPFVFGRGGEEIEELAEAGIRFQVVPGISAANGCSAYAGIPLTHRDHAQSVRFVTGHLKPGSDELDWTGRISERETLVIYMGLAHLDVLCKSLLAHGMSAAMPAALVERGTTLDQRVHIGTLASLPALTEGRVIHAPTLLIVGSVVTLSEKLQWFATRESAE